MSQPPTYDESTLEESRQYDEKNVSKDERGPRIFSIREEVGQSRSQHVNLLISKLLPHIRERAKQGLSRTRLLLLPSGQSEPTTTKKTAICQ
jgi:hypothetical protein